MNEGRIFRIVSYFLSDMFYMGVNAPFISFELISESMFYKVFPCEDFLRGRCKGEKDLYFSRR